MPNGSSAFPFSDEELVLAYRLVALEADARDAVKQLREWEALRSATEKPLLMEDTYVILSLLSADLEKRVRAYRFANPHSTAAEQTSFDERRRQLEPWVSEQLARLRS